MLGAAAYVLIVTAFLCLGAWLAERVMTSLRWPRRGVWLAALALSITIPAWRLPAALPHLSPVQLMAPASLAPAPPAATTEAPAAEATRARAATGSSRLPHRFWTAAAYERVLLAFLFGWGVLSAALIGRMILAGRAVRAGLRRGTTIEVDGTTVAVSEAIGPAVLGVLRPRIAVPRGLLADPAACVAAVTHEREHLRAHDWHYLLAARWLVVLLPWNLPLWWLGRRLGLAIELDCDARIERRVRILGAPPRAGRRWAAAPLSVLTGVVVLGAVTFPAPPIDAAMAARNQARQAAAQWKRQRVRDARAMRRLLANGRPDALAAAAVLDADWPLDLRYVHGKLVPRSRAPSRAAERLAWLQRAAAEAPSRPGLLILQRYFCGLQPQRCDLAAIDARLRALNPDNGADWVDVLAAAVKAKDRIGVDAALAAIGRANRVDTYGTRLFARLAITAHRIGDEPLSVAYRQVEDTRDQLITNGLFAFDEACNRNGDRLSARRLSLCRKASEAFEHSDTFSGSEVGSGIAMRLWPAGTPEHHRAVLLRRRLDFMEQQSQQLLWPPGHRLQTLLALYDGAFWAQIIHWSLQYPSEQDVLRAQLIHAGLPVDPPPGWKDPYDTE